MNVNSEAIRRKSSLHNQDCGTAHMSTAGGQVGTGMTGGELKVWPSRKQEGSCRTNATQVLSPRVLVMIKDTYTNSTQEVGSIRGK